MDGGQAGCPEHMTPGGAEHCSPEAGPLLMPDALTIQSRAPAAATGSCLGSFRLQRLGFMLLVGRCPGQHLSQAPQGSLCTAQRGAPDLEPWARASLGDPAETQVLILRG